MEHKYVYDFCGGKGNIEPTGLIERRELEEKKIQKNNWTYKKMLETRIFLYFFLFMVFSLILCVLTWFMGSFSHSKNYFKTIFDDKSKIIVREKNFEALSSNFPVHGRRLRNKFLEVVQECSILSILDLTKHLWRNVINYGFYYFYNYGLHMTKHYYYKFLNFYGENRKKKILLADEWYEHLIKAILNEKKITEINPSANEKYKDKWRKIVIKESEKAMEVSNYKLLLSCLIKFAKFLHKRHDFSYVAESINNIISNKFFELWLTKEDLEENQKHEEEILQESLKGNYTQDALNHWNSLLFAISPTSSSTNNLLNEKTIEKLKELWIYTVSSSNGVILDDLHRIDHSIIAYVKFLQIYKEKFKDDKDLQLIDIDAVKKAKSWKDIQNVVKTKLKNIFRSKFNFEDIIGNADKNEEEEEDELLYPA